jgi:hypothetical protein
MSTFYRYPKAQSLILAGVILLFHIMFICICLDISLDISSFSRDYFSLSFQRSLQLLSISLAYSQSHSASIQDPLSLIVLLAVFQLRHPPLWNLNSPKRVVKKSSIQITMLRLNWTQHPYGIRKCNPALSPRLIKFNDGGYYDNEMKLSKPRPVNREAHHGTKALCISPRDRSEPGSK